MLSLILSIVIISQSGGIEVTQGVIIPSVLQKEVLTPAEMEALENTVGGIFMGFSDDSNYVYINERPVKIDKKVFNFKSLPEIGEDIYIRMETRGKEKVGIFGGKTLDEAVYYKKGMFK
uniref:Uncharacterized protein n=1 Tax=candidate division WOR-3 bacterium TaxID=2052148 RepID=A0A7V3ZXG4_UNCW3